MADRYPTQFESSLKKIQESILKFDNDDVRATIIPYEITVVIAGGICTGVTTLAARAVPTTHRFHMRRIRGYLGLPNATIADWNIQNSFRFQLQEDGSRFEVFHQPVKFSSIFQGASQAQLDIVDERGYTFEGGNSIICSFTTDALITGLTNGTYYGNIWLIGAYVKKAK